MSNDIRKISVGPDYKGGAMHYIVGQKVLNDTNEIHLIKYDVGNQSFKIYIINEGNEVILNEELIATEMEKLQAEYDSNEYKRKRKEEYPNFLEYLDGIVKNDTEQIQTYIDACLAIKTKYPKP